MTARAVAMLAPIEVAFTVTLRIDVPLIVPTDDENGLADFPRSVTETAARLARAKLLHAIDGLRDELAAQFEGAVDKVTRARVKPA